MWTRYLFLIVVSATTLLGVSGCVTTPWTGKVQEGNGPEMKHAAGPFAPGVVKPGPPPGWQGPPPGPVAPGPGGVPFPGNSEQASFFTQKMADLDDERRVLATRITQLETQLREKDRALVQASFELQEATAQIGRTREDLDRWKNDMEKLRAKLRSMEKDSKVTLETIIHTLEQFFDRNPEARRPLDVEEFILPRKKGDAD